MKNKKLIILLIVIVIAIGVTFGAILIFKKNNKDDKIESDFQSRAVTIVHNNYLLSYLFYGDILIDDSYIIDTNEKYYRVNDKILENITSISDIINLIEDTLTPYIQSTYINYLHTGETNNYLEENGSLYVKVKKDAYKNIQKYNDGDISYDIEDGKMNIKSNDFYTAIEVDGEYYLTALSIMGY